jgi:hypothetical protein
MVNDRKLFIFLMFLIALPVALSFFGGDRFRYPCQDPENWAALECNPPVCLRTKNCATDLTGGAAP